MMLANVVASGYKVSIGDALITAILGYAVVFFGLRRGTESSGSCTRTVHRRCKLRKYANHCTDC